MFTLTSEKASRRSGVFIILRAKSVVLGEKSKKIKNTLYCVYTADLCRVNSGTSSTSSMVAKIRAHPM
jgi:hypothetical protein